MPLAGATVAVTGATGFVGRYLVDALRARGARVVGVVRNPDRVPALHARGVTLHRADLADRAALTEGFRGADAVVSNAALFSLGNRDWDEHQGANVRGTTNVLDAAAEAGVARVVHVSSVAVYAHPSADTPEDAPQLGPHTPRSFANAYAVSKAVSEQVAWERARAHGLALTTLRPCAIYGAFDPNFTAVFRRLVSLPITIMPAWMHLALVYGGDVAEAAALALERPASVGRAYNVAGEADRTLWDFAAAWRMATGRATPVLLPLLIPFTRTYDIRRARAELGWTNRPFAEALRDTFARERDGAG